MQAALDHLLGCIDVATTRVAGEYFQLPVAGSDAVYRERVYCYELYHQLRCQWNGFRFTLDGEVDKSGNPHFADGPYARAVPDFLIHTPGYMGDNLAVIEVKPATVGLGGVRDDLAKLTWFCENARYFRGIFLVYGEGGDSDRIASKLHRSEAPDIDFGRVLCLYHRRVGERPERVQP